LSIVLLSNLPILTTILKFLIDWPQHEESCKLWENHKHNNNCSTHTRYIAVLLTAGFANVGGIFSSVVQTAAAQVQEEENIDQPIT
jgi:hypothetical protein